jgi:hypothetical protein
MRHIRLGQVLELHRRIMEQSGGVNLHPGLKSIIL